MKKINWWQYQLNYRGDVKSKEANATTMQWLKNKEKCTTEFNVRLNERPAALVQDDDIGAA